MMPLAKHFRWATLIPLTGAILLSGCLSLGGKAPDSLLTLTSVNSLPAGVEARRGEVGSALTIMVPSTPQKLRTPRVPVQSGDINIAYVQDATWVEPPARLFQRLLSETVTARTTRLVLDESEFVTGAGEVVTGQLLDFGVDANSNQAVVTYLAVRMPSGGGAVEQRRFEGRAPLSRIDAPTVGAALNDAANRVAVDVAAWLATP
ncbi:MAG: ABC-type transport auxiliary lipoprotein family protein [Sphingopyxis sp.]